MSTQTITTIKNGLPLTLKGAELYRKYYELAGFFSQRLNLSYAEFDFNLSYDLALCTFFKNEDLDEINNTINEIYKALPYLINIFKRPLIHLKELDTVMPIDAVQRISHRTIKHLSIHTEVWKSVKNGEIEPNKLLTKVYEDDFGIYENIAFVTLIDKIITYLRVKIHYLSETLYSIKESHKLESVSRYNHSSYYLAIGKLYKGFYERDNSDGIAKVLQRASKLYTDITSKKHTKIYAKNATAKRIVGSLKRTNILSMHKDYKHVYALYQKFEQQQKHSRSAGDINGQNASQNYYELFVQSLLIFAASNFNFRCQGEQMIFSLQRINCIMHFKNWTLRVWQEASSATPGNIIKLEVSYGQKRITYCLIPITYYIEKDKKLVYEKIVADLIIEKKEKNEKYIFFDPYEFEKESIFDYNIKGESAIKINYAMLPGTNILGEGSVGYTYAVLPITISDINSFRILQKLLLECMVLTNEQTNECAFCGNALSRDKNKMVCARCRGAVAVIKCNSCASHFKTAYLSVKKPPAQQLNARQISMPDFFRIDKEQSYRNTTKITDQGFVCPSCENLTDYKDFGV